MLRDPLLPLDLALPRTVKRDLQARSVLRRDLEVHVLAFGGCKERAYRKHDFLKHRRPSFSILMGIRACFPAKAALIQDTDISAPQVDLKPSTGLQKERAARESMGKLPALTQPVA